MSHHIMRSPSLCPTTPCSKLQNKLGIGIYSVECHSVEVYGCKCNPLHAVRNNRVASPADGRCGYARVQMKD